MSKYYRHEDVVRAIAEQLCWEARTEYGDKFTTEDWLEEAEDYVSDLPTIEVMEYPQVEGITPTLVTPEVSEDTAIRIVENECFRDDLSKEIKDYLFSDLRHKLYHEQAEVSEDCISREYILGEAFISDEYNRETRTFDLPVVSVSDIEDAPSVVPSRTEGEWIYIEEPIMDNPYGRYRCSECDIEEPHETDYCPSCGAKMKGADNE